VPKWKEIPCITLNPTASNIAKPQAPPSFKTLGIGQLTEKTTGTEPVRSNVFTTSAPKAEEAPPRCYACD